VTPRTRSILATDTIMMAIVSEWNSLEVSKGALVEGQVDGIAEDLLQDARNTESLSQAFHPVVHGKI